MVEREVLHAMGSDFGSLWIHLARNENIFIPCNFNLRVMLSMMALTLHQLFQNVIDLVTLRWSLYYGFLLLLSEVIDLVVLIVCFVILIIAETGYFNSHFIKFLYFKQWQSHFANWINFTFSVLKIKFVIDWLLAFVVF